MNEQTNPQPRSRSIGFHFGWLLAVAIVIVAVAVLVLARDSRIKQQTAELQAQADQGERVLVRKVSESATSSALELPATIHGYSEAPLYAKVPGYLKNILVDKGDHVRKGQVLAVLESPELEQQVANARASYELAAITDKRNQQLVKEGVIAQQTADESHNTMLAAKASLDQALATEAYKTITAPFSGIITARNFDPGALIPQATASSNSTSVLTMATVSPVRVYADVPQTLAPFLHDRDPVTITVSNYPNRTFKGSITRHPSALADASRTMLIEADLENRDQALFPGMYATMAIHAAIPHRAVTVPDDALVYQNGKPLVPVVRGDHLKLIPVTLGQDDGVTVQVEGDVSSDDVVAINVGQSARDGEKVQAIPAQQ